jgi:hypothetical protein
MLEDELEGKMTARHLKVHVDRRRRTITADDAAFTDLAERANFVIFMGSSGAVRFMPKKGSRIEKRNAELINVDREIDSCRRRWKSTSRKRSGLSRRKPLRTPGRRGRPRTRRP